jgi:hypothetical protein
VFGRSNGKYECLEFTPRLRHRQLIPWSEIRERAIALRDTQTSPQALTDQLIKHIELSEQHVHDALTPASSARLDDDIMQKLFGSQDEDILDAGADNRRITSKSIRSPYIDTIHKRCFL